MKKFSTALAAAGLLALSACGGSESGSANGADEANVATSDLNATDTLDANALGTDANTLGTDTANLTNGSDLNLTDTGNATGGNATDTGNATGNSQ